MGSRRGSVVTLLSRITCQDSQFGRCRCFAYVVLGQPLWRSGLAHCRSAVERGMVSLNAVCDRGEQHGGSMEPRNYSEVLRQNKARAIARRENGPIVRSVVRVVSLDRHAASSVLSHTLSAHAPFGNIFSDAMLSASVTNIVRQFGS